MMDNKDKVKEIIKFITGEEALVVAVPVDLIHYIGCPRKAVALAQIIYLSDRGKRPDGFVFKTYDEMLEVTGIKENTLRNYFKEFKKKGYFEWKIKKANAFPTLHFKFNLGKFSNSFRKFLEERYSRNQGNETSKIGESLTKNTNKDISPIIEQNDLNANKKEIKESVLNSDSNDFGNSNNMEGFPTASSFNENNDFLSSKFCPSLENLYWAVANFPGKSPKLCTEGFIDYFTIQVANRKNTVEGWQAEWRKWITNEYEDTGYNEEKLIAEHNRIKVTVRQLVHKFAIGVSPFLLHRDSFYSILCKEEYSFSKDAINDCLKALEKKEYLTRYFGDYYYVSKTIEDNEFTDVTDFSLVYDEWNSIDNTLQLCIVDNKLVHRSEIDKIYPEQFQASIDIYLKGSVQVGALVENEDYYFCRYTYEEDRNYRNAVDTKLTVLGIKNSFVIESEDNLEDEFDFNEADFPDYFGDYFADKKARRNNHDRDSNSV